MRIAEKQGKPFLSATWKYLVMLNYEVDPKLLLPHLPYGTELDRFQDKTFVSMVGFLFQDTRVMSFCIPFHRNFEEINLRFYVRYRAEDGWRRGVVFVKEIVPRLAVAIVARNFYHENYIALPTKHEIAFNAGNSKLPELAKYSWRYRGAWNNLSVTTSGQSKEFSSDSEEGFITEHYWGYTRLDDQTSYEYKVEHPKWKIWVAQKSNLECDVLNLYGARFCEALSGKPSSAFLAEGSEVKVFRGNKLE